MNSSQSKISWLKILWVILAYLIAMPLAGALAYNAIFIMRSSSVSDSFLRGTEALFIAIFLVSVCATITSVYILWKSSHRLKILSAQFLGLLSILATGALAGIVLYRYTDLPEWDLTVLVTQILFAVAVFLAWLAASSLVLWVRNSWEHRQIATFCQAYIGLALLLMGGAASYALYIFQGSPEKQIREFLGPVVDVQVVHRTDEAIAVRGYGTVRAKVRVQVVPEVSGKVVEVHPNLVGGGFFRAEDTLMIIDPRDYELAVQRAQAVVARSQVQLDIERAEAAVARLEWQQLNPGQEPTSPLTLREPQICDAEAQLQAAQAGLEKARLDLDRTRIRLPFDGRIIDKTVDLGQYLQAGQAAATVYGTDVVEIPVPLEDRELAWLDVPDQPGQDLANGYTGSDVEILAQFAGSKRRWQGRVVRTQGRIDAASRQVYVIVEVTDPFQVDEGAVPLVPGMFVEAVIRGGTLADVIGVPIHALRNGEQVWVVEANTLIIKDVKIARQTQELIYISSGLDDQDLVVTSPLDTVTNGMKVRTTLHEEHQTASRGVGHE